MWWHARQADDSIDRPLVARLEHARPGEGGDGLRHHERHQDGGAPHALEPDVAAMQRQRGGQAQHELADDRREDDEDAGPQEGFPEAVTRDEPAVVGQTDELRVERTGAGEPPVGQAQADRPDDRRNDEDAEQNQGRCQEPDDGQVLAKAARAAGDHRSATSVIASG